MHKCELDPQRHSAALLRSVLQVPAAPARGPLPAQQHVPPDARPRHLHQIKATRSHPLVPTILPRLASSSEELELGE